MTKRLVDFLKGNLYVVMLYRLLIIYVIYAICRIAYYFYNIDYFPHVSGLQLLRIFGGGLKFDTTAILYVNILFILGYTLPFKFRLGSAYQKTMAWIYAITNSFALLTNIADILYYPFTFRRTTWDVFAQYQHEQNKLDFAYEFMKDYWYTVLIFIGFVFLYGWLYKRIKIDTIPKIRSGILYYSVNSVAFLVAITLFIGGVRGGFEHSTRPITLSNASAYVENPSETVLVLNTPFSLIRTIDQSGLKKKNYFSEDEVEIIYSPIHQPINKGNFNKKNVVVFILESFAKEYVGGLNQHANIPGYTGYTPFLDSLINESLVFENAYANGKKSIEALPSILSSIPGMRSAYVLTPYSYNEINSLPGLLKKEGYYTAFFHGASNGSMGFDAFTKLAGIDHYFGRKEYNNDADYDGIWGIWDEPFFHYFAQKMNSVHQPFCCSLFSISSHHPFEVPEKYEGKVKEGPLKLHRCINYTDIALRNFFKEASKMPWFKNTIFVITADHSSFPYYKEYNNNVDKYSIPLIFYTPDGSLKGRNDSTLAQQIDIMPTVLSYLSYNKPYLAFGEDLLSVAKEDAFAVNFINENYQFFLDDYVLVYDGKNVDGLYAYKKDRGLDHKINNKVLEEKLLKKAKAFIQQYNNRMVENRLVVK